MELATNGSGTLTTDNTTDTTSTTEVAINSTMELATNGTLATDNTTDTTSTTEVDINGTMELATTGIPTTDNTTGTSTTRGTYEPFTEPSVNINITLESQTEQTTNTTRTNQITTEASTIEAATSGTMELATNGSGTLTTDNTTDTTSTTEVAINDTMELATNGTLTTDNTTDTTSTTEVAINGTMELATTGIPTTDNTTGTSTTRGTYEPFTEPSVNINITLESQTEQTTNTTLTNQITTEASTIEAATSGTMELATSGSGTLATDNTTDTTNTTEVATNGTMELATNGTLTTDNTTDTTSTTEVAINGTMELATTGIPTTDNTTSQVATTEKTTEAATIVYASTEQVITQEAATKDVATSDAIATEQATEATPIERTTEKATTAIATTEQQIVKATTETVATTDATTEDQAIEATTNMQATTDSASPGVDIKCPDSMDLDITDGSPTSLVTWPPPTVSSSTEAANCQPASGSQFSIGNTDVVCDVRDNFGNEARCSFTVAVTAWCPDDIYVISAGFVTFPETRLSETRNTLEECVKNDGTGTMHPRASRLCGGSVQTGAHWQQPVFIDCLQEQNVNEGLDELAEKPITDENVDDVSDALASLTNQTSGIDNKGVASAADILDGITKTGNPSPEVTSDVVQVVDNMLQVDDDSFESTGNASSRIVKSLEAQVSLVLSGGGNFSSVTHSLAVKALHVSSDSVGAHGVGMVARAGRDGEWLKEENINICPSQCDGDNPQSMIASIMLPKEIVDRLPSEPINVGQVPLSFMMYQNDKLFRSRNLLDQYATSYFRTVGSSIVVAAVDGVEIDNLPSNSSVLSTFSLLKVHEEKTDTPMNAECVFWDFKMHGGIGDWSNKGCHLVSSSQKRAVCSCNHLTSFAVLVDVFGQTRTSPALDIISKIGCGVSVISLIITIAVYIGIRSLRVKIPSRILICLCFSLLCLYLIFLVGIEQTSSGNGCLVVAVLLHYFTLASMAWMAVEATNMYLLLVKVINTISMRRFMLHASLAAWGAPLIIVVTILAVDYTQYQSKTYCFLKSGPAFLYGEMAIIGVVLLYNTIIFIMVLVSIYGRNQVRSTADQHRRRKASRRVQNALAISVLLGLTWSFGLLSVLEASNFAFQVLFSVFNSLQGLFIFLLFCLRQDNIRAILLGKLKSVDRSKHVFCLMSGGGKTPLAGKGTETTHGSTNSPSGIELLILSRTSASLYKWPSQFTRQPEYVDNQEHPFAVKQD
ncbi:adhesion G-protein coupled receptor G4-like [Acanthaster planci]|uniref:Adhesion G-protein coupled receptor G4-like n=1 Tax=Acanthaster planci TaxID=133434 RepID=A0A8B7ZGG3_ACAPL|nr:adhesion G-protein coupled receptor G4-like [Acanthaster planci]